VDVRTNETDTLFCPGPVSTVHDEPPLLVQPLHPLTVQPAAG
jgi:hypothetical protein